MINVYAEFLNMAVVNLTIALGASFTYYYLLKTSNYKKAAHITVALIMMLFFALYYVVGYEYYSLVWSSVFIILTFALLGRKIGLQFSMLFFIITTIFGIYNYINLGYNPFDLSSISNIAFANLSILLICYYYEYSIEIIQEKLRRSSKKFKELSITDELTGLFNRSEIDRKISLELKKARTRDYTFSLLIADLDNFKTINDEKGHLIGDKVMTEVSNIFKTICGDKYFAGRWGGDEFLLVLPNQPRKKAYEIGELIRKEICKEYYYNNQTLTASIAVTEYKKGDTPVSIFRRVDKLLYKAKDQGKNRTIIA
jgi:diguanylate cyclase (GGDEF)-like protein